MKQYAARAFGEEQARFRVGSSIIDQLHTMRQMLEESIEHNQKVFINIIDFKQVFNSVWHNGIYENKANCRTTRAINQTCAKDISKVIKCHKSK